MKLKLTLLISLFLLNVMQTHAQEEVGDCLLSNGSAKLKVNNVEATLQTGGDLWWDRSNAGYFVPSSANPSVAPIFSGAFWIGGVDPGGNLKVAAQTYGAANGDTDYWAGPLNHEDGTTDMEGCEAFDRFWRVKRLEIEDHIADFSDGSIDDQTAENILMWPAKGNPMFEDLNGFELPNQDLAPFHDENGDGLYNPLEGDYPSVKGDEAIWWVFNDAGGIHTVTNGIPIRAEVQVIAYAFASEEDYLNNTTFYEFNIINRALEDANDLYTSLWVDIDLGCYEDDYVGCSPENKMAFAYNADAIDGNSDCVCLSNIPTYCEEIPLLGIKVLNDPVNEFLNQKYFSSFMAFPAGVPATPNTALEYYRLMSGQWATGDPLTFGGNGWMTGDPTSYAYPDPPNDPDGWSMCAIESQIVDQRMLINNGPFDLGPGEKTKLTYAVLWTPNVAHPCPDISPLIDMGNDVQDFFDNITAVEEPIVNNANLLVFPNPMHQAAKLIYQSENAFLQKVELFSSDGKLLRTYDGINSRELQIQKEELPAGLYFYKVQTSDHQLSTGRLVME